MQLTRFAEMVELVDTLHSGCSEATHGGSSPPFGKITKGASS